MTMREHFVLGGKGAEAWLTCPNHDDLYVKATGSSGFGTDEDCIGCLVAEQAWDEGWYEGNQYGLSMYGDHRTDNPYRAEAYRQESGEQ